MNIGTAATLSLCLLATTAVADPPLNLTAVETPAVPSSLLSEAKRETSVSAASPQTLRVLPGVNEIIPVAVGHLNRIITPFDQPQVRTVSLATTQIEGPVLYVAPADENPVTLYVTPGDTEELALSLTLAPRRIPPREIRLTLEAEHYRKLGVLQRTSQHSSGSSDRDGNPSQDYVADLKQTFRALALMRTPRGFSLREPQTGEFIRCRQPGLKITTGQALEGRDLVVLVGVVRNGGVSALEIDERSCAAEKDGVLAVAAWPKVLLEPGEASELYVAVRRAPEAETTARPSLLTGIHR
jgi:conjugal transfer pilus assembly protein TraK